MGIRKLYVIAPFILEGFRLLLILFIGGEYPIILELMIPLVLVIISFIKREKIRRTLGYLGMYSVFRVGALLLALFLAIIGIGLGDAGIFLE